MGADSAQSVITRTIAACKKLNNPVSYDVNKLDKTATATVSPANKPTSKSSSVSKPEAPKETGGAGNKTKEKEPGKDGEKSAAYAGHRSLGEARGHLACFVGLVGLAVALLYA